MSKSNRGLVFAGKRVLVVGENHRLGSAAKNMADVCWFGQIFATQADAAAYGKAKFGCVPVDFVPPVEILPAPVEEVKPAPVEEVKPAPVEEVKPAPVEEVKPAPVEEVKPLGILPAPDIKEKKLADLKVPELRALCKVHGLKGYSRLAKAGLVEMLKAAKIAA